MTVIEDRVRDHSDYQTALFDCNDWLNATKDRIETCSDVRGDIHSLQICLDRLEVN